MCSLGRKFEGYIENYVVIGNKLGLDSDNDTDGLLVGVITWLERVE